MHLSAIHLYPLKSGAALSPPQAQVEARGLAHDRRWMLVDCVMTMAVAAREKGDHKAARDYATQGIAVIDGLVEIDARGEQ